MVVMGVTTQVCVKSTMREANDRCYDYLMVEYGTTTSDFLELKVIYLAMIMPQGSIVG